MKSIFQHLARFFLLGLAIIGLMAVNLLVHESGHCIAMNIITGGCEGIYVAPGYKVWPLAGFGERYNESWDGYIGLTHYYPDKLAPTRWHAGLVSVMGSGSTAVLSLIALLSLWVFQPHGWVEHLLMIQALTFGDLFTYTILPGLFGLPHFLFFGGRYAEPLEGALKMGFDRSDFMTGVLVFSGLMFIGWLAYAWRSWQRNHRRKNQ
jgi:hypothetical protein